MVVNETFDARPNILNLEIKDSWEENIQAVWKNVIRETKENLQAEYGVTNSGQKLLNFNDVGAEPFSVISYHNKFFRECKAAFVIEAYYPALTGACALGERVLNHLILKIRDYFKSSRAYKRVYDKESFDNWDVPLEALKEWGILLNEVSDSFKLLQKIRNDSLHFNQDLEIDCRTPALKSLKLIQTIIAHQFGSRPGGNRNWFIENITGFSFIKKDWETSPFIREFYLPAAYLVGPRHRIENPTLQKILITDSSDYEEKEISDEEFVQLIKEFRKEDASTSN